MIVLILCVSCCLVTQSFKWLFLKIELSIFPCRNLSRNQLQGQLNDIFGSLSALSTFKKSGIGGGGVAGIVISILVVGAVVAFFAVIKKRSKRSSTDVEKADSQPFTSYASQELSGSIAVCQRGVCDFSTKAEVAQSGGASGMLVINSEADGLPVMDCPHTKTLNISIPSVVVTKTTFIWFVTHDLFISNVVELLLYAPVRPVLDMSLLFLWFMAVGP
ncbi:hypothetical protein DCAR_0831033 [Daucus carota subsp. sativus]|uniref:PA domain-containing protein n=1 Tax=Daucus carota subsp. sativus TaxID=79200 RepID=A0AAF0XRB0_DAUCS|nr:hypothetical protein DCAR_0831033 [Daucus carota subsp. sativus]